MGARFITAARTVGNGVPAIQSFVCDSSATFIRGAAVVVASDGELEACGADPTVIAGFAAAAASTAPGYDAANSPNVVTGRSNVVSVYLADANTVFSGRGVNGGTDPSTPTLSNIGESYGLKADANGIWTVDLAEVTTKTATIVDVDIDQKIFFFKIVQANYQFSVAA